MRTVNLAEEPLELAAVLQLAGQEPVLLVTPEITEPLGPNDPKPSIYFPKDFLVRLDPKDVPQQAKNGKSKKN